MEIKLSLNNTNIFDIIWESRDQINKKESYRLIYQFIDILINKSLEYSVRENAYLGIKALFTYQTKIKNVHTEELFKLLSALEDTDKREDLEVIISPIEDLSNVINYESEENKNLLLDKINELSERLPSIHWKDIKQNINRSRWKNRSINIPDNFIFTREKFTLDKPNENIIISYNVKTR